MLKGTLWSFFFFLINKEQLHLHSKVCVSLRFNGYNECTSYSNKKKKNTFRAPFYDKQNVEPLRKTISK